MIVPIGTLTRSDFVVISVEGGVAVIAIGAMTTGKLSFLGGVGPVSRS